MTDIITFQNVLWTLSLIIVTYGVNTINQLNQKMAVIVEKVSTHDDLLKEHSSDIKELLKQGAK